MSTLFAPEFSVSMISVSVILVNEYVNTFNAFIAEKVIVNSP